MAAATRIKINGTSKDDHLILGNGPYPEDAYGGGGLDTFDLSNGLGNTTIKDLEAGEHIVFHTDQFKDYDGLMQHTVNDSYGNARIIQGDTVVTIEGYGKEDLDPSFFTFVTDDTTPTPPTSDPNQNTSASSSQVGPLEVLAGMLSVGAVSIGIGIYNHYTAWKNFKTDVSRKVQQAYASVNTALDEYAGQQGLTRQDLTIEQETEALGGKRREQAALEQADIMGDKKRFITQASRGWGIAGLIAGFGIGTLVAAFTLGTGGLFLLAAFGIGVASALVAGGGASLIARAQASGCSRSYIRDALCDPTNRLGESPKKLASEVQEQEKDIRKILRMSDPVKQTVLAVETPDSKPEVVGGWTERVLGNGEQRSHSNQLK